MPFVIGGRVSLTVDEGTYAGASCDVDTIDSQPLRQLVAFRVNALLAAAPGSPDELAALQSLYAFVEAHARPVWNLVNAKGPVPATAGGMLLVPVPLLLAFVDQWADTFPTEEP